jgi:hypothetical protein
MIFLIMLALYGFNRFNNQRFKADLLGFKALGRVFSDKIRFAKLTEQMTVALRHYKSFMSETELIRDAVLESAAACEAEIESAIDRARGN